MHIVSQAEASEDPERFFGRPVLFHCHLCERVAINRLDGASLDGWHKESVALQRLALTPEDVWWFHVRCERCQTFGSSSVAI